MKVITISGYAKAGKDLSATILKEKLEFAGKKVLIVHYADYLKFIAQQYFGWDGKKDEKGRSLLQWLGTDKVRKTMPDFWVDIVVQLIRVFSNDFDYFIVPDTRFDNEVTSMKENFDTLSVHVTRLNFDNGLTQVQKNHPSEIALDGWKFDWYITSETGKDNLSYEIKKLIEWYEL
jgi:hypothetical protein